MTSAYGGDPDIDRLMGLLDSSSSPYKFEDEYDGGGNGSGGGGGGGGGEYGYGNVDRGESPGQGGGGRGDDGYGEDGKLTDSPSSPHYLNPNARIPPFFLPVLLCRHLMISTGADGKSKSRVHQSHRHHTQEVTGRKEAWT